MSVCWVNGNVKFKNGDVVWTPQYERVLIMAEKLFKVNEAIEIVYQAPNKESGLTGLTAVEAEIYLPSNDKDSNFPDVALVEIGSSGTYNGTFTPDAEGEWKVIIHKSDGDGQVVKRYSVGLHNVSSVGEGVSGINTAVADLDGDVVALDTKVEALPDAAEVNAEVDTALAEYGVSTKVDEDAAHAVTDGKIDALALDVDKIDTPPMVS